VTLIAPAPKPVAGTCAACGEPIHWNPQTGLWAHETPAAAWACAGEYGQTLVEPVRCSHCHDVHNVHQQRRGPLCDGCFALAPVVAEYGTGLAAEAQADGEHIKLKVDSFNPFGSSAYMTADDTRALIELLQSQLKVLAVCKAEQALDAWTWE
jgi:hypothetical protein